MLLVIANGEDEVARALAARWASQGCCLLAPDDLSTPGWDYHVGSIRDGNLVAGSQKLQVGQVTGVLSRLSWVWPTDLVRIVPADRPYVAAEINAFLAAWLTELPCPVLNRPTPTCLAGPYLRPEQWVRLASCLGVGVQPVHRRVSFGADGPLPEPVPPDVTVTVLPGCVLGTEDRGIRRAARRIAEAAGADLLAVDFALADGEVQFLRAGLWPDISGPEPADAVLEYLERGGRARPES